LNCRTTDCGDRTRPAAVSHARSADDENAPLIFQPVIGSTRTQTWPRAWWFGFSQPNWCGSRRFGGP